MQFCKCVRIAWKTASLEENNIFQVVLHKHIHFKTVSTVLDF